MSDLPRCPNCDARTDPYGRDGGHSWCMKCREEAGHFDEVQPTQLTVCQGDPLKRRAA